jgi:ABC-2 type transport system permease protein
MDVLQELIRQEWRLYRRQPSAWLLVGAASILLAAAGVAGHQWVTTQHQSQAAARADEAKRLREAQQRIVVEVAKLEKENRPLAPAQFGSRHGTAIGHYGAKRYAILPPAPLASLVVGDTDVETSQILVSVDPKQFRGQSELQQPLWLRSGRFDAAFLIAYVLPLLLIAAIGPAISADKNGTLQLMAAQGMAVWKIALVRVAVRALPVVLAVIVGLWLIARPSAAGISQMLWITFAVAAYSLFWMGIAALMDATSPNGNVAIMRMVAVWMVFAFAVPAIVNSAAVTFSPVDSRSELEIALREAQQEVWTNPGDRVMKAFFAEHPEIDPKELGSLERFMISQMRMVLEEEARIQPLETRYAQQRLGQAQLAGWLRFASPVLIFQFTLEEAAGTGAGRRAAFRRQFDQYFRDWQEFFVPRIYNRTPIPDVHQTPKFTFVEEPWYAAQLRTAPDMALLGLMTAGMILFAVRSYRKMPMV